MLTLSGLLCPQVQIELITYYYLELEIDHSDVINFLLP
jgi:hypothetical protein